MRPVGHVVYLHGFASSPESGKATRFVRELAARGVGCTTPDLNLPDFETLTITRMLAQVDDALAQAVREPIALIGSSLGGFVAIHAAAREQARAAAAGTTPRVDRLILLAPAVDAGGDRLTELQGISVDSWRADGYLPVFHHAENRPARVHFGLYEDPARADVFGMTLALPMLVFQGTRDTAVDPAAVERWAAQQPSADLRLLDDGHQLSESMDDIWRESARFLSL